MKAPIQVEVVDADVVLHIDGGHMDEAEPQPDDAPSCHVLGASRAVLAP
jgi:hypothetical protein